MHELTSHLTDAQLQHELAQGRVHELTSHLADAQHQYACAEEHRALAQKQLDAQGEDFGKLGRHLQKVALPTSYPPVLSAPRPPSLAPASLLTPPTSSLFLSCDFSISSGLLRQPNSCNSRPIIIAQRCSATCPCPDPNLSPEQVHWQAHKLLSRPFEFAHKTEIQPLNRLRFYLFNFRVISYACVGHCVSSFRSALLTDRHVTLIHCCTLCRQHLQ